MPNPLDGYLTRLMKDDFAQYLVADNMLKNPTYAPYCMRCPGMVRMVRVSPTRAECKCGAVHQLELPEA